MKQSSPAQNLTTPLLPTPNHCQRRSYHDFSYTTNRFFISVISSKCFSILFFFVAVYSSKLDYIKIYDHEPWSNEISFEQ